MKICQAPRYQGRLTLAERLQIRVSTGWRAVNAKELATICADDGDLSVIGIAGHLLKRWWTIVESDQVSTGFEDYARELVEYFQYKNWFTLPRSNVLMEVVASGGKHDKALIPSNPMRFGSGVGTLFACINLDDEDAAIALKSDVGRIRIILEPGEGLRFPESGIVWNRSRLGNSDLAVMMLIGALPPQ